MLLEVIDIDVRDAQVAAEHDRLREFAIEHAIEPRSIQHAGERVAAARILGFLGASQQHARRRLQRADFLQCMQVAHGQQLARLGQQVLGIVGVDDAGLVQRFGFRNQA